MRSDHFDEVTVLATRHFETEADRSHRRRSSTQPRDFNDLPGAMSPRNEKLTGPLSQRFRAVEPSTS